MQFILLQSHICLLLFWNREQILPAQSKQSQFDSQLTGKDVTIIE